MGECVCVCVYVRACMVVCVFVFYKQDGVTKIYISVGYFSFIIH